MRICNDKYNVYNQIIYKQYDIYNFKIFALIQIIIINKILNEFNLIVNKNGNRISKIITSGCLRWAKNIIQPTITNATTKIIIAILYSSQKSAINQICNYSNK